MRARGPPAGPSSRPAPRSVRSAAEVADCREMDEPGRTRPLRDGPAAAQEGEQHPHHDELGESEFSCIPPLTGQAARR